MNRGLLKLCLASSLVLAGCASVLSGKKQNINVDSNVQGASVYINGVKVGVTPFSGQIDRTQTANLRVSKEGYRDKSLELNVGIEPVFWANIISGGPFASTTDYSTGSMWRVTPNIYNIDLQRLSSGRRNLKE